MAVVKQPFPSANTAAADPGGNLGQIWYYLLQLLWRRSGGSGVPLPPVALVPTGSPFLYDTDISGTFIVDGGTVSEISIVRSAQNIVTGVIAGAIPIMRGDTIAVTYTGAPTMTFLPSELAGSAESN